MNARGLPVVLIAEDDLGDRALLQQAFEATAFQADLRFAANGEEFLAYVRQEPPWGNAERPDLILLDLNMPRMGGREALRKIKRDPALRAVPIIVVTNSQSPEDVAAAYELGANSYITKPHSFDEFTTVIRTMCEFWFKISVLPGTVRLPPR
jgi:two-component system, response regulator